MRDIQYIFIHCTACSQDATVESIKRYWREQLNWRSYGYNYIIPANGDLIELASIDKVVNGVRGYNSNSIHVSYIGGKDGKDTRTGAQKKTLERIIGALHILYPEAEIMGHYEVNPNKACPSFDVQKWLKEIGL